jgi:mannitol 2-dehydrogenase
MSTLTTARAAAIQLNNEALTALPPEVARPTYRRSSLTASVVHLGVGGFHRAHQAVYLDDLAALGVSEWGIVGVGIRRPEMAEVLAAQDQLFTVIERGPVESRARVIGSMLDSFLLAEEYDAVLARLCDPQSRLVTLTVTGGAYEGAEEADNDAHQVFSVLVAALARRRSLRIAPFTVLSCDNLPDSGAAARRAVMAIAADQDAELAEWIEERVAFPSSMVDRITPGTSPADRDQIEAEFSISDGWPVITEPYRQWVIEDWFCNDRPPLERVGVRFVADVRPYRLIKSRLLNGTHSALGYLGALAGHSRTDSAMADPILAGYVRQLTADEILPQLPAGVPGMELRPYRESMIDRLGNPAIADPLSRLCRRGTVKMPDYLIPSLAQAVAEHRPHQLLTLAVAAWLVHLSEDPADRRLRANQPANPVDDSRAGELDGLAQLVIGGSPLPPELSDIFGALCGDRPFADDLRQCIESLRRSGARMTISNAIGARQ